MDEYANVESIADLKEHFQQITGEELDVAERAFYLAIENYKSYQKTGQIAAINDAVHLALFSVQAISKSDKAYVNRVNNLGVMLGSRYERTGQMRDLDDAIGAARQAVESTPDDHPDQVAYLNNLGNKLSRRYERTGQMQDLENAIGTARQAVESTSDDHPNRIAYLNNLGVKLESRYKRTGQMQDLEDAIRAARQAVESTPDDHPDRAAYLNNLGMKLESRYERTGQMQDLEDAISAARQAMESTPNDHPDRATYLNSVGTKLENRYGRTGQIQDLENAISTAQQAVDSTPDDHPDRAAWLSNLGNKLGRRYERTGQMQDLKDAINTSRKAVESTPDGHPDRIRRLNNLAVNLSLRYERTGQMQDLEDGTSAARQAVESTPNNHPDKAMWLNNLAADLVRRYERTWQMQDLEDAITAVRKAIESTPNDHPDQATWLNDLAANLGRRYERTGQMQDLEDAITIARQAIESTPDDHLDRARILNNLGNRLISRYERTGQMQDLEDAISTARQAVESTPDDHPDRVVWLNNLGNKLGRRYKRTGQMQDLEDASTFALESWNFNEASPFHRVRGAALALQLLPQSAKIDRAAEIARKVIEFLPVMNRRFLDRADQQFILSTFSGIASASCAVMLQAKQTHLALELLEQGRTVILSELIGDRTDLSELIRHHPQLGKTFDELRDEINAPVPVSESDTLKQETLRRRREAVEKYEVCVQEIRNLHGFNRFLLGPTVSEMQALAIDGTIIVVNITDLRSDAIVTSSAGIKTVELPSKAAQEARVWLTIEWSMEPKELREMNKRYREYLAWLWKTCIRSILEAAGITEIVLDKLLPRIWWIGTGLASSMPLHAAGFHNPGSTENVFCRAISSYTPSFRALGHAKGPANGDVGLSNGILAAIMTTTPGSPSDLSGVDEINEIKKVAGDRIGISQLEQPSVSQVAEELQRCSIAHFACHGKTEIMDPSASGLILQKASNSGLLVQDVLTVQIVSELKLKNAAIAYLSACSTAENKAARLADEVIHVVSGFQVAGFRHVVGCLWRSCDPICVIVAMNFYSRLLGSDGGETRSNREVASALHGSILAVRSEWWKQPLKWAQFVHYGA
jgi:tetratricopeptide (TPR) repeat protein